MRLRVFKTNNTIKDICITNAIARTLDINDIEYEINNGKAFYIIETEEFDLEELEWIELETEDDKLKNINSYMSFGKDIKPQVEMLNGFMQENICDVFRYFESGNKEDFKHMFKSAGSLHVGAVFETLGVRGGHTKESHKVSELERHLAFFGWICSASYVKNDTMEITAFIIPNKTNEILKPFVFSGKDKETGEVKTYRMLSSATHMELMAKIYMKTMENKEYLKHYDKAVFTLARQAGNKPLPSEYFEIDKTDWSLELIDIWNMLYMNIGKDVETNLTLSSLILYKRYKDFDNLLRLMATKKYAIFAKNKEKIIKEMLGMFNDKINQIYFCDAIKRLGMAFGWLSYDKKAFDIQASLNTVSDKYDLQRVINDLSQKYQREKGKTLLNTEQLEELFDIVQDRKDARVAATAILMSKTVFQTRDKSESNEETESEEDIDIEQ